MRRIHLPGKDMAANLQQRKLTEEQALRMMWCARTYGLVHFPGHAGKGVFALTFNPDGKLYAFGDALVKQADIQAAWDAVNPPKRKRRTTT